MEHNLVHAARTDTGPVRPTGRRSRSWFSVAIAAVIIHLSTSLHVRSTLNVDLVLVLALDVSASVDERGHSVHPGDVRAQARRAFTNIRGLLESERADWHDVVRTTCYLADFRYYDEFNEVRNEFYAEEELDPLPASTCVEARICRPELLVEIEAIAVIPQSRTE